MKFQLLKGAAVCRTVFSSMMLLDFSNTVVTVWILSVPFKAQLMALEGMQTSETGAWLDGWRREDTGSLH